MVKVGRVSNRADGGRKQPSPGTFDSYPENLQGGNALAVTTNLVNA